MDWINEGCINCGREEHYPGCDNPNIRYLCGVCTTGLLKRDKDTIAAIESEIREMRPPHVKIRRTRRPKERVTLATATFKKGK